MQYRNLSGLKKLENNPRVIKDKEFQNLCDSIKNNPKFFEARPLILSDRTGHLVIIAGNQRYEAAKTLELKKVPTYLMEGITEEKEREITIRDNTQQGAWDMDALANAWGDLPLTEWGLDLPEHWMNPDPPEAQDAEPQIDRAEELNKIWKVKAGDLWQIEEHRLLCGDSTKAEDVARVMGGERAIVFTDPPYGIEAVNKDGCSATSKGPRPFGGKKGKGPGISPAIYSPVRGDNSTNTARDFYSVCRSHGLADFIIFGGNYFTDFLPPSKCWLVWDKQTTGNLADCELAWTSFNLAAKLYPWLWNGLSRQGGHAMELKTRVHPTQKPVGLAINIMNDFPSDIYFDGFIGSGSFMVAAENIKRHMFGIESEPLYIATVLQRMTAAFPGIEIRRIE